MNGRLRSITRGLTIAAMTLPLVTGGAIVARSAPAGDWQSVKAATARYHSSQQAEAAGYSTEGEPCVSSPAGTMGIHAVNRTLTADQSVEATRPEIMLYIPKDNGRLELVGVEYFQVALANTPDGPRPWFGSPNDPTDPTRDQTAPPPDGWFTPRPSVLGQSFDGPMPGHNPFMPWHYDMHVWLWEDNPAGMFAPWNPTLSCPA